MSKLLVTECPRRRPSTAEALRDVEGSYVERVVQHLRTLPHWDHRASDHIFLLARPTLPLNPN